MAKSVLAVGNCFYDQECLESVIGAHFDARVHEASRADEALKALAEGSFDLVLVNRVLVPDGSSGIDLIQRIKDDPHLANTVVMLVSDLSDAQEQAVQVGAEPGFGKKTLNASETIARLKAHLS